MMSNTDSKLSRLAREANDAHEQAQQHYQRGVEHATRAGKALIAAKREVAHGHWGRWLAENFHGSERLAQIYMRLAQHRLTLDDEIRNDVADLSLREAMEKIATPKLRVVTVKSEDVTWPTRIVHVSRVEHEPITASAAPKAAEARTTIPIASDETVPNLEPDEGCPRQESGSILTERRLFETLAALAGSQPPELFARELASTDRLSAQDLDRLGRWLLSAGRELTRLSEAA